MKRQKPDDKQIFIISLVGVITLIIVMIGATYAYFSATSSGEGNIDTNVGTSSTDNLSFAFGEEIHISATEENFAQGMPSLSDSTTGTALLRPNNYTNQASATYNIYLIIESNDFEYTTENQTPEILLKVTSPTGEEVENITGLVHTADGFDITTRTGGFLIISDYEITADQVEEMQQWNIEVTFVNLDTDQQANTEKTLTAKLYMTQEKMSSYEIIEINNIDTTTTYNQINATLDLANGTADPEKYYYGIEKTADAIAYNESSGLTRLSNTLASAETVEYVESDSANYTFKGLESNTEYTIYSYVVDANDIKSNVYQTNVTTGEYTSATIDSVSSNVTLNSITLTVSASNGSNEIAKYMYSIDNGTSWVESESNTYTFDNLTDSTTYHVKVKVVDSEEIESTPYYKAITTTVYVLPIVANVTAEKTWNSITLTPTGTNGTNEVDHYLYSIDGGTYQESNVFSNLNDNQEYTINVKAIDTAGRESELYELKVTTDEYIEPNIGEVTTSATDNSITINVTASGGTGSIATYHYSKDNGLTYEVSNEPNYTFDGLTSNVTFYIKVYVTDSNGKVSGEYSTSVETVTPTLAGYCTSGENLAGCITEFNNKFGDGAEGIYHHDLNGTYANASLEAGDNSYRFSGTNPSNYVCFASDAATCPTDNLYRIIGVFDNSIKLIKHSNATTTHLGSNGTYRQANMFYDWNNSDSTIWSTSVLNTVNLNTNYVNYLNSQGSKWLNMIKTSSWQVGGNTTGNINNVPIQNVYFNEILIPTSNTTYNARIGLMYVSDYGYASDPSVWTSTLNSGNIGSNNWISQLGLLDWTITRSTSSTYNVFIIAANVDIGVVNNLYIYVRPVFYLNSSVTVTSGDGTISNPYRVTL